MMLKYLTPVAAVSVLATAAAAASGHAQRPSVAEFGRLKESRRAPGGARLTAHFLGTTTIILSDGETTIMTDGFFSRPSVAELLKGPVAPNRKRIEEGLDAASVATASAILVAHSHHDHAMDSPYVASLTGAKILGSASTGNIALGADFPADRIEQIEDGSVCRFGDFIISVFRSPHSSPTLFPGRIAEPLGRSARVWDYKEGGNFTFHISHPWGNVLIVPSMGIRKNWSVPYPADTVFLGVGGLPLNSRKLTSYWRQFVEGSGAKTVYPIHWDNFFKPPPRSQSAPAIPRRLRSRLAQLKRLAGTGRRVLVPPYGTAMALGEGRHGGTHSTGARQGRCDVAPGNGQVACRQPHAGGDDCK
jgi:L-ascorbate metabolism protein UlaG (beta-lactamase superfamily)